MIEYTKGAKYQTTREYTSHVPILGYDVVSNDDWIRLESDGKLTLKRGYAWDGSSGPTIDTKTCMQASAEHDALSKLMRWELLPRSCKEEVDKRYHDKCLEDGMMKVKADLRVWVLRMVHSYVKPSSIKRIYRAP